MNQAIFAFIIFAMIVVFMIALCWPLDKEQGVPRMKNPPPPPPTGGNFHTKHDPSITKEQIAPPPAAVTEETFTINELEESMLGVLSYQTVQLIKRKLKKHREEKESKTFKLKKPYYS